MTTKVLICDDSKFARRQMARVIPDGWNVELNYAENGQEAIAQIKAGRGDIVFLDLNMPVMDGYQAMEAIRQQDLPCLVIVVSGDVQPEARKRMIALGALDFIRKPIDNEKLVELLNQYGIYTGDSTSSQRVEHTPLMQDVDDTDKVDIYREMVNVAMGRAGENLARSLGEFVELPIPNVNFIDTNDLHMAVAEINHNDQVSAVSKGFVSMGIQGEALVLFNNENNQQITRLLGYDNANTGQATELEALLDVSNILTGACLNALGEQLELHFSHGHPIVLGRNIGLEALLNDNISRGKRLMAIEIAYAVKRHEIQFDLLLLFPDSSMDKIYQRLLLSEGELAR